MTVKIRLARTGKKKDPKYRIVVMESKRSRDSIYLEKIGHYDPMTNPTKFSIDEKRLDYWLNKGAQYSKGLARLIRKYH